MQKVFGNCCINFTIYGGLLQDLSQLNTEGCDEFLIIPDSEATNEPEIKKAHIKSPRKMGPPTPSRPAKLCKKVPTWFEKTASQLQTIAEMSCMDHEDQHDKFGKLIAAQLREMPPRSVIILQDRIQSIITSERLRLLDLTLSPNTPDATLSRPQSTSSYDSGVQEDVQQNVGELILPLNFLKDL